MDYNNPTNNLFREQKVVSSASDYIVLPDDVIINISDTSVPRTVTLPAPSSTNVGKFFIIKDTSGAAAGNAISITPAAGLIDGAASFSLNLNYGVAHVFSDGTNYYVNYVTRDLTDPDFGQLTWIPYATTVSATVTNPTLGAGAALTSSYLQQGKLLHLSVHFAQSNAGTTGSGGYYYNLPSGFTADTSIVSLDTGVDTLYADQASVIGTCHVGRVPGSSSFTAQGCVTLRTSTTYWICPRVRHQNSSWFPYSVSTLYWGAYIMVPII